MRLRRHLRALRSPPPRSAGGVARAMLARSPSGSCLLLPFLLVPSRATPSHRRCGGRGRASRGASAPPPRYPRPPRGFPTPLSGLSLRSGRAVARSARFSRATRGFLVRLHRPSGFPRCEPLRFTSPLPTSAGRDSNGAPPSPDDSRRPTPG